MRARLVVAALILAPAALAGAVRGPHEEGDDAGAAEKIDCSHRCGGDDRAAFVLTDPIFQGLAISLVSGSRLQPR